MNASTWLVIYMPIMILLFIIVPQQNRIKRLVLYKIRKRKELKVMSNDLIKKYIQRKCKITTGSFGTTVVGKIVDIKENWIEIETKKGNELINADFIQSIKQK